jgi:hypothetical protein
MPHGAIVLDHEARRLTAFGANILIRLVNRLESISGWSAFFIAQSLAVLRFNCGPEGHLQFLKANEIYGSMHPAPQHNTRDDIYQR